jgi:hypothetical protein
MIEHLGTVLSLIREAIGMDTQINISIRFHRRMDPVRKVFSFSLQELGRSSKVPILFAQHYYFTSSLGEKQLQPFRNLQIHIFF